MLTNLYLYGTSDVPLVPKSICNERLRLLEEELTLILQVHYLLQDNTRLNKILKAISFWEKLRDGEVV